MDYSLTGDDIVGAGHGKASYILYPQIAQAKTLDDILGENGATYILYEFQKHMGHWVLLFETSDGGIEFFDSYNYQPDSEFEFIPVDFRERNMMMFPALTKLLLEDGRDIHYNQYQFQSKNADIATCGRHCAVRLRFRKLDIDEYRGMMGYIAKRTGLNFDEIVLKMTSKYPKRR